MKTELYNYKLPDDLIALEPEKIRDNCKLLVVNRQPGNIEHKFFTDIELYLNSGDVVILNNTRVIKARLYAQRESGARIEIVLLDTEDGFSWRALTNRTKRLKQGEIISLANGITAKITLFLENGIKELEFSSRLTPEVLDSIGEIPLPPYIKSKRQPKSMDEKWYQTVFAEEYGSKASPTAGLHFTESLIEKLKAKGVIFKYITLHISLSTFNPIRSESINDHEMHTEYFEVNAECVSAVMKAKQDGNRVFAVGTTAVRALEASALSGEITPCSGLTDLYIQPGFKFNVCDAVITNFHTPRSTLLVLVSAFAGYKLIKKAYEIAVKERYRFLSYGDSMLIV